MAFLWKWLGTHRVTGTTVFDPDFGSETVQTVGELTRAQYGAPGTYWGEIMGCFLRNLGVLEASWPPGWVLFFFFFFFFHTQILVQKRVYLGPKKWPIWGAKTPKIGPKMAKKHFLEHQKRLNWWWLGSTLPTFWFLSDPISPPLAHFWDTRNRPPQGVRTTKVGVCPKTRKCVSYQHCYKFPKNSFEKIYYRCLYVTICIFFLGET